MYQFLYIGHLLKSYNINKIVIMYMKFKIICYNLEMNYAFE